jgi:RanBP1 domain
VFDNPNGPVNNGGFVNPFQSKSSNEYDKSESESDGDDKGDKAKANSGKSLFDRVSEPKSEKKEGGLFSNGGDQAWSSDKGLKFNEGGSSLFGQKNNSNSKPFSLFGTNSTSASPAPSPAGSSLFGTSSGKSEVGFSFGTSTSKPTGPISMPSAPRPDSLSRNVSTDGVSTPGSSFDENSEPNDNNHNAKNDVDLSGQGPGEEDEDSLHQIRAIIYELKPGHGPVKAGVGTLRVLKNRINSKARVIVRTESGRPIINVSLKKELKYEPSSDKKQIQVPEFLPGGETKLWAVRVRAENTAKLADIMESAKS